MLEYMLDDNSEEDSPDVRVACQVVEDVCCQIGKSAAQHLTAPTSHMSKLKEPRKQPRCFEIEA